MKITLIYSDNNFKEQVEKLAKQYNLSIDLKINHLKHIK